MSWLDRQNFLGTNSDLRLAGLTVGIVGLGGGGSHLAQQLAHVGVGGFVLVDGDQIDESNLNRLVGGTHDDVAREAPKVEVAARMIRAVNPNARIELAPVQWQEAVDQIMRCDVVLGSMDNVRSKDELEAFCRRILTPYIDQGMDVHAIGNHYLVAGQVLLSVPGGPCLRCLGIVTEDALVEEGRKYGAAGGKPQVVWPNGVLASTAVGLLINLVTPWHPASEGGECLEYDGNLHTLQRSDRMALLRGRPCPHHPGIELGDPSFDVRRLPSAIPSKKIADSIDNPCPWWTKAWHWLLAKVGSQRYC